MKFKTTIEIVTEAEDKTEALDVVGEYLSGTIASGVDMKCSTRLLHKYNSGILTIVIALFFVTTGATYLICANSPSRNLPATFSTINAIQPPLKTSDEDKKNVKFKDDWQQRQTKEALNRIVSGR